MRIVGIIPARFGSSRFPGKPLAAILGKPMIARVVENVSKSRALSRLIVATDDERIAGAARAAGAEAVIVAGAFATGTDRVAAVARDLDADVIVNVQGDEPLLPPEHLDALVAPFESGAPGATASGEPLAMATLASRFRRFEDVASPRTAKVVVDDRGRALYFSRTPVPFAYRPSDPDANGRAPLQAYLRHIGVYAYARDFLAAFAAAPPSPLETAEGLEQLRALGMGARIQVVEVAHATVGVDTPEDLVEVERLLREQVESAAVVAARG